MIQLQDILSVEKSSWRLKKTIEVTNLNRNEPNVFVNKPESMTVKFSRDKSNDIDDDNADLKHFLK